MFGHHAFFLRLLSPLRATRLLLVHFASRLPPLQVSFVATASVALLPPPSILWIAAFIHSLFFLFASNLLYIFVSPGRTDAVAQTRLKHSAPPSSVYQVRIVCSCAGNVPEIATCSIKIAAALMAASRHTAEARPNPRAHCLLTFPSVSYFFHCCIDSWCWGFDLQTHSCSD